MNHCRNVMGGRPDPDGSEGVPWNLRERLCLNKFDDNDTLDPKPAVCRADGVSLPNIGRMCDLNGGGSIAINRRDYRPGQSRHE